MQGKLSRIQGRVTSAEDKRGLPNLRVEVWEADIFSPDDLLGEAVTRADGTFELSYDEGAYAEMFEGEPEFYFRVYSDQHVLEEDSFDIEKDPDSGEHVARISVLLPPMSASDVELQNRAFVSHLEAVAQRCDPDDPQRFLGLLGPVFVEAGETRNKTASRLISMASYADIPSLSPAQASIYHVARVEARGICTMLSHIIEARAEGSTELESASLVTRTAIGALLEEFSRPEGPHVERVDNLFAALFDQRSRLQELLAAETTREGNYAQETAANVMILSDYVDNLWKHWTTPDGLRTQLTAASL